jgi:hypothetical protein
MGGDDAGTDYAVNLERGRRVVCKMGIAALEAKSRTNKAGVVPVGPNQIVGDVATSNPIGPGFLYLAAVTDSAMRVGVGMEAVEHH